MRVAIALSVFIAWPASSAAGQMTLVVRSGAPQPSVEASVADVLRDQLGGSVRRVDSSLDELALAAGCDGAAEASSEQCIATIARAAGASLVAIERIARDEAEWTVRIDVRRADGTHVSMLGARCDEGSGCAEALTDVSSTVHHDADPDATAAEAPSEISPGPQSGPAPSAPSPQRSPSIEILPHVLLISATLLGAGSFVAAAVALDASSSAASLGMPHTHDQIDHARALQDQSSLALGIGIALASCGAGLAAAGAFTLAGPDGPRLHVGVSGVGLSVSF